MYTYIEDTTFYINDFFGGVHCKLDGFGREIPCHISHTYLIQNKGEKIQKTFNIVCDNECIYDPCSWVWDKTSVVYQGCVLAFS